MKRLAWLAIGVIGLLLVIATIHHSRSVDAGANRVLDSTAFGNPPAASMDVGSSIPFVGCESDGQLGPEPGPNSANTAFPVDSNAASALAYYMSAQGLAVLAPRGWYCFGTYGSNGESLFVSPQPVNSAKLLSVEGFTGPLIQLSRSNGGTSGRFTVAQRIARVFPAHREFVKMVLDEGIDPADSFPAGPYPNDELHYKSAEVVEYQTPALTDGLGTDSRLRKDSNPITGVLVLVGSDPDIVQLSVRLSADQARLRRNIIEQAERDYVTEPDTATNKSSDLRSTAESSPSTAQSSSSKGFPVPEDMFVNAYVLANIGHDDLDEDQLVQLAHDEYRMARSIDTVLLLSEDFLGIRSQRAMKLLEKLSRQRLSAK